MGHGPTSRDAREFAAAALARLAAAAEDLRLLLGRGYGSNGSLELVGNHFRLTQRQRQFLYRCVSVPAAASGRRAKVVGLAALAGARVLVDGYNCLIIGESCLAGGVVLLSDDGVLRDILGVYGAYRLSARTDQALALLTGVLAAARPAQVTVYLDARMRFAQAVAERWQARLAAAQLPAEIRAADNADRALQNDAGDAVVASSDRDIMDAAHHVVDLPRAVAERVPGLRFLRLPEPGAAATGGEPRKPKRPPAAAKDRVQRNTTSDLGSHSYPQSCS